MRTSEIKYTSKEKIAINYAFELMEDLCERMDHSSPILLRDALKQAVRHRINRLSSKALILSAAIKDADSTPLQLYQLSPECRVGAMIGAALRDYAKDRDELAYRHFVRAANAAETYHQDALVRWCDSLKIKEG